jgi:hypothetical protein
MKEKNGEKYYNPDLTYEEIDIPNDFIKSLIAPIG